MDLKKTLSIIKPDAIASKCQGKILDYLENKGFKVIAQKKLKLTRKQAEAFYEIHKDRPFFSELVDFMISDNISVQVLEAENAVSYYREVMGNTDPEKAEENTIRKLYGSNIQCNAVHGSDSEENAEKEISFFFNKIELIN
ncbi:MAG: Nucleoside diphosphate kinase [Alphaproteobacteria bacterium MarineAlpha9_Bin4]|nr:nucleoside-diphosphate kinase [Pelagibacterales bacterium]PPR26851.1 MAG: Nucleoside diphosphate kinase [Alphaproteobacteria bacterium MarineAlpha9_Bin4]|tara:strand:- start:113 stop:535 length:423 start_codon:yes stop_codon:yes gene_type:complete